MIITARRTDGKPNRCPGCDLDIGTVSLPESSDPVCTQCGQPLQRSEPLVTVIRLEESQMIHGENWENVQRELLRVVNHLVQPRVLLDLQDVRLLSSTAFSGLLTLQRKIQADNGQLVLCNVRPQVREVFEFTRLNQVINIRDTETEGLAEFRNAGNNGDV